MKPDHMNRRLVVEFTKMAGAGNDFVVIDNRFYRFSGQELERLARELCRRRTGIGADGLLALDEDDGGTADFTMRYLNADGSVGTMCGNGARCIARYARMAGMDREPLVFRTDAGPYSASVPEDPGQDVRLHLPAHGQFSARFVDPDPGTGREVWTVWTGTEHAVLFVPEVAIAPVERLGPRLRADRSLGERGVNVDFVEVAGPAFLRVRTYEKGVEAETLACGTGATAAAVTACITGRIAPGEIGVEMSGGRLTVGVHGDPTRPEPFYLQGPADVVFRGTVEV